MERVYAALDDTLAEHLTWLGSGSIIFDLLSHGMHVQYDGTHMLESALDRFDAFSRSGVRGSGINRLAKTAWLRLDDRSRDFMKLPLLSALRRHLRRNPPQAYFEHDIGPVVRSRQRYFKSPNNTVYGGVRINLKGREPAGLVSAGKEFDIICNEVSQDLLSSISTPAARWFFR